jgi:hypothetical protein
MGVASIELAESEDAELTGVLRWRFIQLCRGGYPPEDAVLVAVHLDIDLHEALRLVRGGCPAEIATRILL